ncbi:hypothetical protein L3Q82_010054 [Scortum barcoo]|uniref:Uncharacterized protein n=1 Tax=Scortum barcoo TaxID=214431 RepID=A0ACB8WFK3_9TELE|nr:hypothetical protein L3Q82_010054 [Scortum barcoo]
MDRLLRRASSVLGYPLDSVEVVGNRRMMAKLSSLLNNTSHPLQDTLTALGSSFTLGALGPSLKAKELVVEYRRHSHSPPATGEHPGPTDIDTVKSYKYLGVHLNDSLNWTHNTDALVKKGNSRLFLLRRLRSFGVQGPLLRTFL